MKAGRDDKFSFAACSHCGFVREENQDRHWASACDGLFLIADGMGGYSGGDIAAEIAITTIVEMDQKGCLLEKAIMEADKCIKNRMVEIPTLQNMGTTIVALKLQANQFRIAWVGDSRAYLISDHIRQLTHDHSLAQEMIGHGFFLDQSQENIPTKNMLTRCVGWLPDDTAIDFVKGSLTNSDCLMLCSDGLHSLVNDEELFGVINKSHSPHHAANELVQIALDAGGFDNVTTLIISNCSRFWCENTVP